MYKMKIVMIVKDIVNAYFSKSLLLTIFKKTKTFSQH